MGVDPAVIPDRVAATRTEDTNDHPSHRRRSPTFLDRTLPGYDHTGIPATSTLEPPRSRPHSRPRAPVESDP